MNAASSRHPARAGNVNPLALPDLKSSLRAESLGLAAFRWLAGPAPVTLYRPQSG